MDEIMQCTVCYSEYDTEFHKPCMGKCGHSICFLCANDERCEKCPVCRRNCSFQEIIVNYGLMNIIEYKNKKKQEVEGICSLCEKEATELAICIDCCLKDGIMRKDYSESKNVESIGVKWNTGSLSLDECIQQAALSSFCVHCSIGTVHNGHRTSSFKNIQKTIFARGMSGIKEEIEGFLNSFDQLKKQVNQKLEEYRQNISSLLTYVAQLTFDQFNNYPKRIMEFIKKSKALSEGLTNCQHNISDSIDDINKKLEANVHSNFSAEKEENIFHLKRSDNKLEIYVYNTISNTMQMETQISVPQYSNSIVHRNHVYIIGGQENGNDLKTVEVYNLNDKTRRKLPDLNEARFCPTVCMHNGKIVVCGGYNRDFVNSLEEYDFDKNEWKIIGRLNDDSDYYRIVSHDNNLYRIGKIYSSNNLIIMKFNKEKSEFETVHQSNFRRNLTDCISFNGKIYIIGLSFLSKNKCCYSYYNPSTNKLSQQFVVDKKEDPRFHSLNNQLYIIDSKSVEVFDEKNNKWKLLWSDDNY